MNVDKTLLGMNMIVWASAVGGLILGIVIPKLIGMGEGLGMVIGGGAGWFIGTNFLLPYFEKQTKEEPEDN